MRSGCYARVTRREGSVSLWLYLPCIQSIENAVSRGEVVTVDPKVGGSIPLTHPIPSLPLEHQLRQGRASRKGTCYILLTKSILIHYWQ